jgi:hypothetical protein
MPINGFFIDLADFSVQIFLEFGVFSLSQELKEKQLEVRTPYFATYPNTNRPLDF